MNAEESRLTEHGPALLLAIFGAATVGVILNLTELGARPLDLLVFAGSLGALAAVAVWLFLIATRHSRNWAIVLAATVWIPYVNLVVASMFARRYWERGARTPALVGMVALAVESLAVARLLLPDLTPPV